MNKMELKNLYDLVKNHFGFKCRMIEIDTCEMEVKALLYDTFLLKCNINSRYGTFGAAIFLAENEYLISTFLGKECSLNSDKESIIESLDLIDNYCSLRLPDKFLEEFRKAYFNLQ